MMRNDHARRRLQDRAREVHAPSSTRSSSCHKRGPAGAGRHHQRREVRGRRVACSRKKGIPHNVLNAKQHEREALHRRPGGPQGRGHHLDQHGRPRHRHHPRRQRGVHGARRGRSARTPRKPGHEALEPEAFKAAVRALQGAAATPRSRRCWRAGGLHILGTERHESRRIDNQLRGRAGRQGDPGSSRFYLSLEDDLMRIFGGRAHHRT